MRKKTNDIGVLLEDGNDYGFEVTQRDVRLISENYSIFNLNNKLRNNVKNARTSLDSISGVFLNNKPSKKIREIRTISDENLDICFIVNFEEGGFVVVAGDKRVVPILAYSDNSTFGFEDAPGIKDWIESVKIGIKKVKKEGKKDYDKEKKMWEIYQKKGYFSFNNKRVTDDCPTCNQVYTFSTPQFVDNVARWGQGYGYSLFSPSDGGCNSASGCSRKAAGCGPIAMAMVMNYYQKPNGTISFNGDAVSTSYPMPRTLSVMNCDYLINSNDRQVPILIRNCGAFASSGYGVFGNCNTWTYPGNINNAFANMGYSSGGAWDGLSSKYPSVKSDLLQGFPVLLTGTLNNVNLNDAHIWVADGYSKIQFEYLKSYYEEWGDLVCYCDLALYEYISLNWGQYGISNGFYLANYSFTYSSSGNSDTYDTYLRALTGIRP